MFSRIFLCYLFTIVSVSVFGKTIELINNELYITDISKNIYVVTHNFPWESNSLIVITKDKNIVLIDTPYTNEATEKIYNWIKSNINPRKIICIVTGYHIDNIGGTSFLKSKQIEVIGTKLTNDLIRKESSNTLKTLISWMNQTTQDKYINYFSKAKMITTTKEINISSVYIVRFDDITLELYHPGESHAKDNITVFIRNNNILFGSCIIKSLNSRNLGFTGDANMVNWPIAVESIIKRYSDTELVIPHHGEWGGNELMTHTLQLLKN